MNLKNKRSRKGFTLIELLVVVAIVAILSITVLLTLNPAELLRQARDSNRISDLATVRAGVSLYLADVSTGIWIGTSTQCWTSAIVATNSLMCSGGRYSSSNVTTYVTSSNSGIFKVDGTGWVPVNFNAISSGAPFGALPRDPINDTVAATQRFYSYAASSTGLTFHLVAGMESAKYSATGTSDVCTTDGNNTGLNYYLYDVGTNIYY